MPAAHEGCLSRVPRRAARTVLRGDRRSNAAVLPDNKTHYPRDVVWREDAQQVYTRNGPQVMASIRNLGLGLFRLRGFNKIKEATEWIARDRAFHLLAT